MRKGIFITGTDTDIGKTHVACAIIRILKKRGIDCGVMKPVQCAGEDAKRLIRSSFSKDELSLVNPFFSKYPYAPVTAFAKEKIRFSRKKVINIYHKLSMRHKFMVVEGAGGLIVPITARYRICDLIVDFKLPIVIVARLGLGTINHTLLSVEYARSKGIKIAGIIFNNLSRRIGASEKMNPRIIKNLSGVPILGRVGYSPYAIKRKTLSNIDIDISRIIYE
ncbi:MAG TPA: dethiobiotin synthase [Candidatus Omnitrophica bacterium]|nr:dethiobiotin synthase [Candidatus Omnitrophota bacterium]